MPVIPSAAPPSSTAEADPSSGPDTDPPFDGSHRANIWRTVLPFLFIIGILIFVACAFILLSLIMSRRTAARLRAASSHTQPGLLRVDTSPLHHLAALIPVKTYIDILTGGGSHARDSDGEPSEEKCAICLDLLQPSSLVRSLPCHHVFHSVCIDQWFLKRHYTCPMCVRAYYNPHP